jgi:dethiobiotin synthetase
MNPPSVTSRRGWVILATDTGVGKTFVGERLARLLVARGRTVRVRKPAESGWPADGDPRETDAARLRRAAGDHDPLERVCPLRYRAPLAPPEAARREGRRLDLSDLLAGLGDPGERHDERWLIEGAGGLLSPLADDALNVDLAVATGLPVVLVSEDRLGTLSVTLSAIEALAARRVPLAAVVLNRQRPADDDHPDNLGALATWIPRLAPACRDTPLLPLDSDAPPDALAPLLDASP